MQLISANRLKSFQVIGKDGNLGKLDGFLVNSNKWQVEFLKLIHGFWFFKRERLIPVKEIANYDRNNKFFTTELTKDEIDRRTSSISGRAKNQNTLNDKLINWIPGTAHHSISWTNPFTLIPLKKKNKPSHEMQKQMRKPLLLRTFKELEKYQVDANDGKVGKVKDFIIDANRWTVSYIIVEGSGKKIMLPSQWVSQIHPIYEKLVLNQNKNLVLTSPYALG